MTTTTPEAPGIDLMAGTLTITLTSPRTGDTRTFRVESPARGHRLCGTRVISMETTPRGRFEAFAFMDDSGYVRVWKNRRGYGGHKSMPERLADLFQPDRIDYYVARGVEYRISGR